MVDGNPRADRQAADWFLLLSEEPDDPTLKAGFEAWLDADSSHIQAWARIAAVGDTLASAPAQSWPTPHAMARLRPDRRRWTSALARPRMLAMAGAMAALLVLALFPALSLRLSADHITAAGQIEVIALKDGSTIHLGPDSALALRDDAGERSVKLLAGKAWFNVIHDPKRPFTVSAGHVTTTDLGTAFEVSHQSSGTGIAVAQGRVHVDAPATPPRDLTGGDWLELASGRTQSGHDRPDLLGAWRSASLMVRNRPIAEAIEDIRPWYAGRIIIANQAIASKTVTGYYDLHDPAATLESLIYPAGGRVLHITPWVMIVTAR